jgi:hypothetical protein
MNYTMRGTEHRHCSDIQSGLGKNQLGTFPGNAILLNGVGQNANREIGVPRVRSPRNDVPYLIRYWSFSDSLARQKQRWRGINFLLPTGVFFPEGCPLSPHPGPALLVT